jgi:hypothetical protein
MSSAIGMSMRMSIYRFLRIYSTFPYLTSLIEDADLWFWQLLWQLAFLVGDFGGVWNLAVTVRGITATGDTGIA